jgi:serine/threonine protein kinase
LLRRIEETPNFIVILSPHSLDRCADERDWLRREIAHAIRTNRNIIPVTVKGFDFPRVESLPEDISSLETHNAVDYSHDYFGPMIDKIIGFLRTAAPATKATPQTKSKSESSGAGPGLTFGRLVAAPDSLIGQRIGKYAVKEFIGAGGSGLVYRALRTALGREVCIKIFYPLIAEAGEAAYIIQRGARALASMNHPHIIKVLDLETLDFDDASSFCLITEFVRGRELRDWSLKIAEADTTPYTRLLSMRLQMATAITTALAAAHCCRYTDERGVEQTGILHGDIKPSNIIVRDDNSPVVLDFMMLDIQRLIDRGFAPLNRPERHEPITAAYGTPGFMPPEQDRDGILTVKSDIFSLGVTLAHLFVPDSDNPLVDLFAAEQDELLDGLRLLVRDMVSEDPMSRPRDMDEVARRLAVCGEKLESDPPAASLVSKAEQVLEAEALAASNATAAGASQSLSAASITPSPAATIAIPAEDDKRRAKRAKMGGLVGALLWGGLAAVTGVAQLNTGYGAGGIKSPFDLIVFIAIGIVLGAGVGFLITASRKGRVFGIAGVLAGVAVNMFLWKEREEFVLATALLGVFGSLGGALAEGSGKKNTAKR